MVALSARHRDLCARRAHVRLALRPLYPCQPGTGLRTAPAGKALLHPLMMALMQQYRTHEVYQQHRLELVNT
jgi:hypothetical protein